MHAATLLAFVLAVCPAFAHAVDHPVAGDRLLIRRTQRGGGEGMLFVARSPDVGFPAGGSDDDPSEEASAGALIELFSQNDPAGAAFLAPADGWKRHGGRHAVLYRFFNPRAPRGLSSVKLVQLQRRGLFVFVKDAGLALDGPQGAVGIRVTMGDVRTCALFDASTVRRDVRGFFSASGAPAAALSDCSDASLGAPAPTSTTTTSSTSTTSTTAPADLVFGNAVEYAAASAHAPDYLLGTPVTVAVPSVVTHLGLIAKAGGAHVVLGLYADGPLGPGALVAETPATPLAPGALDIPVPPTPVAAGTYWLMAVYDGEASVGILDGDPGAVVHYTYAPFAPGLPNPLDFTQIFTGQRYNYYLRALP